MRHAIPAVNWSHPLNRGLVSWWLAWPAPAQQAMLWVDLCGQNHLTADTNPPGWTPSAGPPGGRGAWEGDGSGNILIQNTTARRFPNIASPVSISAWIYTTTTSGTRCITSLDAGGFSQAIQMEMRSTTLRATAHGGSAYVDSGITPTTSTWVHLLYTWDGTTNRIYTDGIERANSVTAHASGAPDRVRVGNSGFNEKWSGRLDDVRYWDWALSGGDAWAYYTLSRAGYPGLLARSGRIIGKRGAAPAAFPWHYYAQQLSA